MQYEVETKRLIIRPFKMGDAKVVQELLGDIRITRNTIELPYPFPEGLAEQWIQYHSEAIENGEACPFAIVRKKDKKLIGSVGFNMVDEGHQRANFGFWIGFPYWNKGYATEAASRFIRFGFEHLKLNRIYANAFAYNLPSSKVMLKIGMKYEGTLRKHYFKNGKYLDIVSYGILQEDYYGSKKRKRSSKKRNSRS